MSSPEMSGSSSIWGVVLFAHLLNFKHSKAFSLGFSSATADSKFSCIHSFRNPPASIPSSPRKLTDRLFAQFAYQACWFDPYVFLSHHSSTSEWLMNWRVCSKIESPPVRFNFSLP